MQKIRWQHKERSKSQKQLALERAAATTLNTRQTELIAVSPEIVLLTKAEW
jgi:hypothetical protein